MSGRHIRPSDGYNAEGGPAFGHGDHHHGGHPGMTLRDWFAGQAIAAFARHDSGSSHREQIAVYAYKLADAMLAQREKAGHP